jgi:hypothetical protein
MQLFAPAKLYCPGPQMDAVELMLPGGQMYPAVHAPLQLAVARPAVLPKAPPGHKLHTPAPLTLYVPGAQSTAVASVEPAGQAYPALQFPTQVADTTPDTLPNRPAGQGPEHADVVNPELLPYTPGSQGVHTPAPDKLKVPAGQMVAVGDVDPAGHAYPAVQTPLQLPEVTPDTAPNSPAGQGAVHALVFRPWVDPKEPALQFVQALTPPKLKVPTPQITAVSTTEPTGHANPAAHGPLQPAVVKPDVEPNVPPGQAVQTPAPPKLYVPGKHNVAVGDVLPAAQAYPAVHGPAHDEEVRADTSPYLPAGQGPEHASVASAVALPYRPAAQATHADQPLKLYVPCPHANDVALTDPLPHMYPAEQLPEHASEANPDVLPYSPGLHKVHDDDADKLNLPGGQIKAEAEVLPASQAYPAEQGPVQEDTLSPGVDPYRPASHNPVHVALVRPAAPPYKPAAQGLHDPAPAKLYVPG